MADDGILAAIAALRTEMQAGLATLRGDVMGRLERMDDKLTRLREDVTVAVQATTTDAGRTLATRREVEDLNEQIAGIQRQIVRLRTEVEELRKASGA